MDIGNSALTLPDDTSNPPLAIIGFSGVFSGSVSLGGICPIVPVLTNVLFYLLLLRLISVMDFSNSKSSVAIWTFFFMKIRGSIREDPSRFLVLTTLYNLETLLLNLLRSEIDGTMHLLSDSFLLKMSLSLFMWAMVFLRSAMLRLLGPGMCLCFRSYVCSFLRIVKSLLNIFSFCSTIYLSLFFLSLSKLLNLS